MEPFRYHVFVCDQQKPEGVPCCSARGSGQVLEALRREINARGLDDEVQVTTCGSLGLCEHGPNLVVYPEGVWYSGVTPADVPEIVQSHFQGDIPVRRLTRTDPADLHAEIVHNRDKMRAGAACTRSRRSAARRLERAHTGISGKPRHPDGAGTRPVHGRGGGRRRGGSGRPASHRPARYRDAVECAGVAAPAGQAGREFSQLAGGGALLCRRVARQRPAGPAAHRAPVAALVHTHRLRARRDGGRAG